VLLVVNITSNLAGSTVVVKKSEFLALIQKCVTCEPPGKERYTVVSRGREKHAINFIFQQNLQSKCLQVFLEVVVVVVGFFGATLLKLQHKVFFVSA
jgi:hypothetical protein